MSSWKSCTFDPISMNLDTQMVQVVFECGNCLCRPCIHAYTQIQYQHICPVCKSVVGENTLYGSERAISGDIGNNASLADQGIEPGAYSGEILSLDFYCIFVSAIIIIQPILFAIYLMV